MSSFFAITYESFLMLRRDKIFVPMFIGVVLLFFLASFVTEWSLDDYRIIYFNITQSVLRLTGGAIAVLFGVKMLHDSYVSGSLETILSRPIHRSKFLQGSYTALLLCLLLYGVLCGICWWVMNYFFFTHRIPTEFIFWGVFLSFLEWSVIAALAYCLSSFCGFGMSLLSVIMMWLLGLMSSAMALSLEGLKDSYSDFLPLVEGLSKFWSFDRFSLLAYSRTMELPDSLYLTHAVGYAVSLVGVLLILAHLCFSGRDIIR